MVDQLFEEVRKQDVRGVCHCRWPVTICDAKGQQMYVDLVGEEFNNIYLPGEGLEVRVTFIDFGSHKEQSHKCI